MFKTPYKRKNNNMNKLISESQSTSCPWAHKAEVNFGDNVLNYKWGEFCPRT